MTEETRDHLQYLFRQFLYGRISVEEYAELWKLMRTEGQDPALNETFDDELQWLWEEVKENEPLIHADEWDEKIRQLVGSSHQPIARNQSRRSIHTWLAAAAVLLLIAGLGVYFYYSGSAQAPQKTAQVKGAAEQGISPGGNKAVLILASGARITLDSASDGVISRQGKTAIVKRANGHIAYNPANESSPEAVYNMLSTPRGGKYQITLADGTKVWLDAASSLRYPTVFSGSQRVVEMTGEAYFEVAENSKKPFVVSVDGMKVKVLGTHFNIMAYDDEPLVKTTLLEGKVEIKMDNGASALLAPGEQAQVNKTGTIEQVKTVNIDQVTAWKNNLFWFDENTIQEVMRQVARWYDADVEIKGLIPQHFTGSIPRNVNVLRVFEVLQETGNIHFKVEDHQIIVTP